MKMTNLFFMVTTPLISSFNSIATVSKKVETLDDYKLEQKNKYHENFQWYRSKSTNEISKLKNNLLNSLCLTNDTVILKKEMIDNHLWQEKFELLMSEKYLNSLNFLFKINLLKFIDNQPVFKDKSFYNEVNGIWFESSWWWFGYWRMHFESDITQKIAWTISNGGDVVSIISEAMGDHPWALSTQFIGTIISLSGFIWDKIPRLSIHFYTVIIVFVQPW